QIVEGAAVRSRDGRRERRVGDHAPERGHLRRVGRRSLRDDGEAAGARGELELHLLADLVATERQCQAGRRRGPGGGALGDRLCAGGEFGAGDGPTAVRVRQARAADRGGGSCSRSEADLPGVTGRGADQTRGTAIARGAGRRAELAAGELETDAPRGTPLAVRA